jgi:uncharacterized protein (DUF169 family)
MSFAKEAAQLQELLELKSPPIAISFLSEPPQGMARVSAAAPSGCTYWKLAAEGQTFYTSAADHYGCPIGSYTHGVELPPAQGKELEEMIGTMVGLSYLKMEEVPTIPRREDPFGVAVYARLADAPFDPDVVIVRGNAKQMMLLSEAINVAGVGGNSGIMGRPTCAMIPAVLKTQQSALSLGCIGNRVYNDLGDEELYFAMPGLTLPSNLDRLSVIIEANRELESLHLTRKTDRAKRKTD